jgi:hypothetical protein
VLTFPFAIRNHVRTGHRDRARGREHREKLLDYQRDFFESRCARRSRVPGEARTSSAIRTTPVATARSSTCCCGTARRVRAAADGAGGRPHVRAGPAWVVPTAQPKYRMVRTIFERTQRVRRQRVLRRVDVDGQPRLRHPDAELRTAFRWARGSRSRRRRGLGSGAGRQLRVPAGLERLLRAAALYHLLSNGCTRRWRSSRSRRARTTASAAYPRGSISIPCRRRTSTRHGCTSWCSRRSGWRACRSRHHDRLLGRRHRPRQRQLPAADGAARADADRRRRLAVRGRPDLAHAGHEVRIPITKVDRRELRPRRLRRLRRHRAAVRQLRFIEGERLEDLRRWVRGGGTLVATAVGRAVGGVERPRAEPRRSRVGGAEEAGERRRRCAQLRRRRRGPRRAGDRRVDLAADLDTTHPLGFGYHRRSCPCGGTTRCSSRRAGTRTARSCGSPTIRT